MTTLIIIAKAPVPGLVKTRLTPPFTPGEAARLAEAALQDTLAALRRTPATDRLLILDGSPDASWLPADVFTVIPQIRGGLDRRLAAAFHEAAATSPDPAFLVGMDTPQITPELLSTCLSSLNTTRAVLGPAADGGFWSIGFAKPRELDFSQIFHEVPMSHPDTGRHQLERLRAAGLTVTLLPELRDFDTAQDAYRVAAEAPTTNFASLLNLVPSK